MHIPADPILAASPRPSGNAAAGNTPPEDGGESHDFMSFLLPEEGEPVQEVAVPALPEAELEAEDTPPEAAAISDDPAELDELDIAAPELAPADPPKSAAIRADTPTDADETDARLPNTQLPPSPAKQASAPLAANGQNAAAVMASMAANAKPAPSETAETPLPTPPVDAAKAVNASSTPSVTAVAQPEATANLRKVSDVKGADSPGASSPPNDAEADLIGETTKIAAPKETPPSPTTTEATARPVFPAAIPQMMQAAPDQGSDAQLSIVAADAPAPTADARSPSVQVSVTPSADLGTRLSPQIVDAIRQTRDGTVEVSLSPEELGRVRLVIQGSDTGVQVSLQTERPETLDLLRRHIGQLHADLASLGYKDIGFNFGQPGAQHGADAQPDAPASASADNMADLTQSDPSHRQTGTGATRRLDLRL